MKTSTIVRKAFAAGDMVRDAGLKTPEDVQRFDNIVYGEDKVWQSLDVYRPKATNIEEKLPVIVSVHGGGWVYGDKKLYQFYCLSLAQRGFAVVNFSYRLAPESKFPASIIDTNLVFGWILDHAEEYGLDSESVNIQMEYLSKIIKDIPVTHFYSSELYGEKVAEYLHIENRLVDFNRTQYPINATKIRENYNQAIKYLEEFVYKDLEENNTI